MSDYDRIYAAHEATLAGKACARIQWKGTDVCADVHCSCGKHSHLDGDFAYFVKCPHCGKVWAMAQSISLLEVPTDLDWEGQCEPREATP